MKELRVYGDSYTATWNKNDSGDLKAHNWTNMLAKKLGYKEVNKATSGGSNASMYSRLREDIKENNISNNNTGAIIVQLSTLGRFYNEWTLKNYPSAGSTYLHGHPLGQDPYYDDNKDHIKWWIAENNIDLESLGIETFLHWLKYFLSKKYSNVKIIVLFNTINSEWDFSQLKNTENFLCFNDFTLTNVSFNEYGRKHTFMNFVKYTKVDPRANHLCNPNLELLADTMFKSIQANATSIITEDIFYKNIIDQIKNEDEYKKYIDKGVISLSGDVAKRMNIDKI
jgi:hypothetical protein